MKQPGEFLTTGKLRERGWTGALITRFMPEPDKLATNPVYRSAAKVRLYEESRVLEIESTAEWKAAAEKAGNRRAAGGRAADTKRERLLAAIDGLKIEVPVMDRGVLIEAACHSYNSRKTMLAWRFDDSDYMPASPNSSPEFLERITVNYLRHELTHCQLPLPKGKRLVAVLARLNESCFPQHQAD